MVPGLWGTTIKWAKGVMSSGFWESYGATITTWLVVKYKTQKRQKVITSGQGSESKKEISQKKKHYFKIFSG